MKKNRDDELKFAEKLADIVCKNDLADIEVVTKDFTIKINRKSVNTVSLTPQVESGALSIGAQESHVITSSSISTTNQSNSITKEQKPVEDNQREKVKEEDILFSPMVGTAYLAPSPDSKNFVQVGMMVSKGQTIAIVEAMKTMNHIGAHKSGVVKAVLVANEQPIEYAEKLAIIE